MRRLRFGVLLLVLVTVGGACAADADPPGISTTKIDPIPVSTTVTEAAAPSTTASTLTSVATVAAPIAVDQWLVLGTNASSRLPGGSVAHALDQESFSDLWTWYRIDGEVPLVDFGGAIVVFVAIEDDACPDNVTDVSVVDGILSVVFTPPPGGCVQPLIPTAYAVAVERSLIGEAATFVLPQFPEQGVPFREQVRYPIDLSSGTEPAVSRSVAIVEQVVLQGTGLLIALVIREPAVEDTWGGLGLSIEPPSITAKQSLLMLSLSCDGEPGLVEVEWQAPHLSVGVGPECREGNEFLLLAVLDVDLREEAAFVDIDFGS